MPGPKKRRASAPADLPTLAQALVAEPCAKANNLPVLLAALTPDCKQAVPVLHSLRLFFINSFDRGDLSPAPQAEGDTSPEAVYATWLHRQYRAYTAGLLHLLAAPDADARTQVAAFVALMECVRGERPGVFNNRLYHRLLETLLTSEGAAPEVLGLLISKFLDLADVRYFTLASIVKIAKQAQQAQHSAVAGGQAAGAGAAAGAASKGEETGEEGGKVSGHDLARTLHDILAQMPAVPPGMEGSPANGGAGSKKKRGDSGNEGGDEDGGLESEEEEEEEEASGGLRSWCGAAEVGIVSAANAGEGARQRKRQRLLHGEDGEGGEGAAAGEQAGEQQHAKWASAKAHQRLFSDAWLALLRMDCPQDVLKKVLASMHDVIIPSLANPLLLADFLTATLDKGGLTGMLALNGIFLLVTRHRLEYPHFYARLYQLLTPEAFHARHRHRFFALADAFLASGMVPAYTAAAFVKRLARLALTAPPAGALLALAFTHNIVRRHQATMQLLHRPPRGGLAGVAAAAPMAPALQPLLPLPPQVLASQPAVAANGTAAASQQQAQQAQQEEGQPGPAWQGVDVYDFEEADPGRSRALESSLWELQVLRQHHSPQVSAYCAILDKDLRDRKKTSEVDVSELLGASYASMFAAEAGRRLKAVPTAFYHEPPARLFEPATAADDWAGWAL